MKRFYLPILFIFISLNIKAQIAVGYINGYYDSYPPSAIDYKSLSYIAMSFIYPNADGSISVDSWFLNPQLVQSAHQHGVKVIVSVGGYGGSNGFSPMAADTSARRKFVANLVNFCLTNNFDGADLDWEYPAAGDRNNFTALCSQLRQAFNDASISTLSAAIPSQDWNNAYDISKLNNYLDWYGIMTYDFYGTWEKTSGNDAPLYSSPKQSGSMDNSVNYYLNKGMPKNKLCVGMPFGGYLLNSTAMYSSNSGGSTISYVDANAKISQGWSYVWDDVCKQPYLQNSSHTQLITYDDTISIKLKCEYICKNNLKGTIIWKIGRDYNGSQAPLLNMIGKYLYNYPVASPQPPALQSPVNGHTGDSTSILLKWNPVDSATSYRLQFSTAADFSVILGDRAGINLTYFPIGNLQNNTKYFWRVCASNLNGAGIWSDVWNFTTKNITAINHVNLTAPLEFNLSSYPNPFNPQTTITYSISKSGIADLSIYNILGIKIKTLLNEFKNAGTYNLKFDGSSLPSGIYFCKIQSGNYLKIIKMELLK
ncbi:MAG: glycosyl hydrolase family 18 protein [Bacteroidetes bacterium]|nr:glycosyl hydrolase family 18 protein [Bacteroidota bacterium]